MLRNPEHDDNGKLVPLVVGKDQVRDIGDQEDQNVRYPLEAPALNHTELDSQPNLNPSLSAASAAA